MITRPLGLAAKLRPAPRSFDAWFFVNAAMLVLFFDLFASRFVLAPGLGVDFVVSRAYGAREGASVTTHDVKVTREGLIIIENGPVELSKLREWLSDEGKKTREPVLLLIVADGVEWGLVTKIVSAANEAGFRIIWAADGPAPAPATIK